MSLVRSAVGLGNATPREHPADPFFAGKYPEGKLQTWNQLKAALLYKRSAERFVRAQDSGILRVEHDATICGALLFRGYGGNFLKLKILLQNKIKNIQFINIQITTASVI